MKKLSAFLFLSAAALLAGCSIAFDPELVPSLSSDATGGAYGGDGTGDGTGYATGLLPPSSDSTSISSTDLTLGWTNDQKAQMTQYVPYVVPFYDGFVGEVFIETWPEDEFDYPGYYVYDQTSTNTIESSNYASLLELDGFEFYEEDGEGYYVKVVNNGEDLVSVRFYWDEGGDEYLPGNTIEVYYYAGLGGEEDTSGSGTPVVPIGSWTAAQITAMTEYIPYTVPFYDGFIGDVYIEAWPEDDTYYSGYYVYDQTSTNTIETSNYAAILEGAGFTYAQDEEGEYYFMYVNGGNDVFVVSFYFDQGDEDYEPGNTIQAYLMTNYEGGNSGTDEEVDIDLETVETVAGNTISFADKTYLLGNSTEVAVWGAGDGFFVLETGTSDFIPGGDRAAFLSDPLRIYAGQAAYLTFRGDVPSSIVLTMEDNNKSKLENITFDANLGVASVDNGNTLTVTLTPSNESVSSFDFSFSAQVRFISFEFVYAA